MRTRFWILLVRFSVLFTFLVFCASFFFSCFLPFSKLLGGGLSRPYLHIFNCFLQNGFRQLDFAFCAIFFYSSSVRFLVEVEYEVSSYQVPAELSLADQLSSHQQRRRRAARCRVMSCSAVMCDAVVCCAVLRAVLYLLFRKCQASFEVLYQLRVPQACVYYIVG